MAKESIFIIGEKIDITNDGRRFFKTMIGDIKPNGLIMIGTPIYKGYPMQLRLFDIVYMVFYRENGRFIVKMRVVDFEKGNEIQYTLLEQLSDPEKNQRREYYRLPARVDMLLCEYTPGMELEVTIKDIVSEEQILADGRTKDISVTGVSLATKWETHLGERYYLKLFINGQKGKMPPFLVCAEVRRCVYSSESGIYDVGMRFFGVSKSKRDFLNKYILTQQQKKIVQKKLIEGK